MDLLSLRLELLLQVGFCVITWEDAREPSPATLESAR
ncbi:unnamed protein product [Linum tenue]|uniref:Uncharacterized protein n=1 Tax=Linum tenue TaxID=586396 RepID=A0AAV0ITE2_9ROSI|nr:unnamed protein product [Linum tenue]